MGDALIMKNSLKKIMALVAVATTLTGGVTALADEGTSSLATTSQVETTSTNVDINYSTHVQKEGWQNYVSNGASAGTTGKALRLEGIKINVKGDDNLGIEYSTHVQKIGWQNFVSNDTLSGTTGQALRLEAIKIKLSGSDAKYFDIYYRVHAQHFGWLGWAKNGDPAGTEGYAYRLEAIQIEIVPKGNAAPGSTSNSFKKYVKPKVNKGFTDGYLDNAYAAELWKAVGYNIDLEKGVIDYGIGAAKLSNICRAVAEGKMNAETATRQVNSITCNLKDKYGNTGTYQFHNAKCRVYNMKKMSGSDFYKTLGNPLMGACGAIFAYKHANGIYTVVALDAFA